MLPLLGGLFGLAALGRGADALADIAPTSSPTTAWSELDAWAGELDEAEARVEALAIAADIEVKEAKRERARAERARAEDQGSEARARRLAALYAAMPPGKAAGVLGRLDPEAAASILAQMPPQTGGVVLGAMSDEAAAGVAEALSR